MRQLGEKKKHHELCGSLLPFTFSSWGKGGGGMICVIFFFSKENWKLPVKERTVPSFSKAQSSRDKGLCHWYKAVLF